MAVQITIENLRHIKRLEFTIPNTGVWLLTGVNGTGKTSLLACMRRLGFPNAFPTHFPASQKSDKLDSFENSSVEYKIGGSTVTYRYRIERWVPHPKANSGLIQNSGFPSVLHIAADSTRIEPRKDDFQIRKVRAANAAIIAGANIIFDTKKFDRLKTINIRTGVGSDAFLLEIENRPGQTGKHYISEKSFSLGELCILKLLRLLKDCKRGSLVLIDELELALHPMAQVSLLKHLEDVSREKALTIIVSTHSSTLIKQANPNQLLLLQDQGGGNIVCQKKCFPSMVLGALAYQEEMAADVIVYVEDEAAQFVVEQFCFRFIQEVYRERELAPSIQVLPVGGIANVLRFFVRQRPLLPAITRCHVLLDADAEQSLEDSEVPDIVRIRDEEHEYISFLPITPEVGLAQYLHRDIRSIQTALRTHYNLQLTILRRDLDRLPAEDQRKECKQLVDNACAKISEQLPNTSAREVKSILLKLLADDIYANTRQEVMRLMGPIIRG